MYRDYCLFFVIPIISINAYVLENVRCNYLFSNMCLPNSPNASIDATDMALCSREEVSSHIYFEFLEDYSKTPLVILNVHFTLPKRVCKFGISLLANGSITSENECHNHKFEDSADINAETHTAQETVCTVPRETETLPADSTDLIMDRCQENITLGYQYIFTGCYAILFHLGRGQSEIRGNAFVKTNYKPIQVPEPNFSCKYEVISRTDHQSKKALFVAEVSVLADIPRILLQLGSSNNEEYVWYSQSTVYKRTINMEQSVPNNRNCSISSVEAEDGKALRTAECRFVIDVPEIAAYCFLISLLDDRCKTKTLWDPPVSGYNPCMWKKRCTRMNKRELDDAETELQAQTRMDTNTYLLLPAVIVVTMMFTIFGMIYLIHYWRTRNERVARYTHAETVHANGQVSQTDEEKEKEYDDGPFNKNIVLLYAKNTESFVAIMTHFRQILARVCHCSIHDWYDSSVWNHVAKIGGPEWFSKMLDDGCRVIWMDTPVMRDLVTSKFHKDIANKSSEEDCIEIGDFRDVLFPIVFNLAKRDGQKSVSQYPKHFIVRLSDFDNFKDQFHDPFTELSPRTRYLIPQDFSKLCSHLNAMDLSTSTEDTRIEEDFTRQHLICVEPNSCK